uniref:Uncharacterized protein n=1 Tax=Coccolithus braarudii TaxID=221442 RepID=A0A7S0PVT2_9EUKA|mmetsp:Transcript_14337/g.31109  ORF Transcript_14337/g.31109 Transcript_14337/m.31109 type:complete len:199 (+) Transcript_14337:20-616(+)
MALSFALSAVAFVAPLTPATTQLRADSPMMLKSQALPFIDAPPKLDGTMAGDVGFDPLSLSEAYNIKYLREAELKHGRICMLALVGFASVDLGLLAPGAPKVSSLLAHDVTVKSGHMLLLLFTVAIFESLSYNAIAEMMSGETDREPGDYCLDPYNWAAGNKRKRMQESEIVHCRLAMMAFSGMVTQSALKEIAFPYY